MIFPFWPSKVFTPGVKSLLLAQLKQFLLFFSVFRTSNNKETKMTIRAFLILTLLLFSSSFLQSKHLRSRFVCLYLWANFWIYFLKSYMYISLSLFMHMHENVGFFLWIFYRPGFSFISIYRMKDYIRSSFFSFLFLMDFSFYKSFPDFSFYKSFFFFLFCLGFCFVDLCVMVVFSLLWLWFFMCLDFGLRLYACDWMLDVESMLFVLI